MESLSSKKRVHSDSDEFNSPEAKRIQHDLLETLEDSDENESECQDLDSFIKSFENEIPPPPKTTFDSEESKLDLEFLLVASDDELGLPPTESRGIPVLNESDGLGGWSWLDDQLPNYDSFEYGFEYDNGEVSFNGNNSNGEYVALEGLFDYTDVGFGSSDFSCRPESLPA